MWPETAEALKGAIAQRPAAKNPDDDGLAFITVRGASWAKGAAGNNPVMHQFKKLLTAHGLHRPGVVFYALRRTFETIAGETLDQPAVDRVMGHTPPPNDMAAKYRQRIGDDRLERVAAHVRNWLYSGVEKPKRQPKSDLANSKKR